uniref:Nuclear receptor subfamily 0 group B member 2 n=1 Tax=Naja naja TaxID=35670 RepID=A0A8C6XF56_NAJNA
MECEKCPCHHENSGNAILYTLLSENLTHHKGSRGSSQQRCLCPKRRAVCLQTPQATCQAASDVLVKTISFMKNLPSFQLLPWEDQLLLLDSCWVPLFLLGLVQETVTFEVTETPVPSMLERILLDGQCKRQELQRVQPTLASVQRLQRCLNSFWSLDLSPKEYAYLKGAILFNPDIPGLRASSYIESLQREAQQALQQVLVLLHLEDQGRFARVLLSSSSLRSIPPTLITDLFFEPIIGKTDILELLIEMLKKESGGLSEYNQPLPVPKKTRICI